MTRLRSSYNLLFDDKAAEAKVDRLYKRMPTENGVLKFTRRGRFSEFDQALSDLATQVFLTGTLLRVHDMGASSGITSLELHDCLSAKWPVHVRASDYFAEILRVRVVGFDVFFDVDHKPLEVALARTALPISAKRLVAAARKRLATADRRLLFHPDALAAVGPTFSVARDDVFAPAPGEYEIVRLMNTLVPAMGRANIERAIRAIIPTVVDGGLLVIGRNADNRLHATIFQRTDDSFIIRQEFGEGFAEKDYVTTA